MKVKHRLHQCIQCLIFVDQMNSQWSVNFTALFVGSEMQQFLRAAIDAGCNEDDVLADYSQFAMFEDLFPLDKRDNLRNMCKELISPDFSSMSSKSLVQIQHKVKAEMNDHSRALGYHYDLEALQCIMHTNASCTFAIVYSLYILHENLCTTGDVVFAFMEDPFLYSLFR